MISFHCTSTRSLCQQTLLGETANEMDSVVWIVNKIMTRLRVSSGVDSKYYDRSRTIKYGASRCDILQLLSPVSKSEGDNLFKKLKKGTNKTQTVTEVIFQGSHNYSFKNAKSEDRGK